jgi:hypothetical protein
MATGKGSDISLPTLSARGIQTSQRKPERRSFAYRAIIPSFRHRRPLLCPQARVVFGPARPTVQMADSPSTTIGDIARGPTVLERQSS